MRRLPNVLEALIVAGLLAVFGLIFSTRETVIRLAEKVDVLNAQLADVPELRSRVTTNEGEIRRLRADVDRLQSEGLK